MVELRFAHPDDHLALRPTGPLVPIAASAEARTDRRVNALEALLQHPAAVERTEADAVRGWAGRADLELSSVKPLPLAVRDGAVRPATVSKLDTENRLSAGKATSALGWEPGALVRAEVDRSGLVPVVVLAPGPVSAAHQHVVPLDRAGRVRLAPTLVGALRLRAGDQVQFVALPERDRIVLYALADIVPVITAALFPPTCRLETPTGQDDLVPPTRRTNVRRPWRPPAAVAS